MTKSNALRTTFATGSQLAQLTLHAPVPLASGSKGWFCTCTCGQSRVLTPAKVVKGTCGECPESGQPLDTMLVDGAYVPASSITVTCNNTLMTLPEANRATGRLFKNLAKPPKPAPEPSTAQILLQLRGDAKDPPMALIQAIKAMLPVGQAATQTPLTESAWHLLQQLHRELAAKLPFEWHMRNTVTLLEAV